MTDERMKELFEELKKYDTPTVTNVVATYPNRPDQCLGLYDPWTINWYTDQSLKCIYPNLGRRVGYAVTCVFGMPDHKYTRLSFPDIVKELERSLQPSILVMKQDLPEKFKNKNGLAGGNMVTAMKKVGCIGLISDGPSRDIDEIREMDFQCMLTGVTAGHGDFSVKAINVPVSVCGMDVCPGEIIHMDENGACKFPANRIEEVVELCKKVAQIEKDRMERIRNAKDAAEIERIFKGLQY